MRIIKPIKFKMYFWLLFSIVLSLTFPNTLKAQEETGLSLDQAVRMALEHDYETAIAKNDLEKAKLVVKEKVIEALPGMEIGVEKGKNLSTSSDLQNASVTVTETIPTDFQLYGKKTASDVEVSKWDRQTSEADYKISQADIIYNTVSLYLNAVKAKRLLDYQETAVKNAQAEAEYYKIQLSLGKVTKVTQLTAENDLVKARYELESNRQDYLVYLKQLAQQIGVKDYRSLRLEQTTSKTVIDVSDYEQLKTTALNKRLELQKTRLEVKAAEQDLAEAINEGFPTLSLAYQNRSPEESYNLEYDFLSGDLSWTAAWQEDYLDDITYGSSDDVFGSAKKQYKLKLSWTLDFGSVKNQVQQGRYTLENAKLEHLQTAQDIIAEVDETLSAYELAVSKISQTEQGIELYQKNLELVKLKHELGTVTSFDLNEAELNLLNAKVENENASSDLQIAAEKLKLKSGQLYDYPIVHSSNSK